MKPKTLALIALLVIGIAGSVIWLIINDYNERQDNMATSVTEAVMYKNSGCQCCDKWATYMGRYGYNISVQPVSNMPEIKDKYHIPSDMESCHTTLIDGYTVEGHVPVEDINRLLDERPQAVGISAPGMPSSSPGMNTSFNTPYDVYLIDQKGNSQVYASH